MPLNIRNEETYRLVRQLSQATGESMTQAVQRAVRERLERIGHGATRPREGIAERLMELADELAAQPTLDERHPDDILYDDHGLPCDGAR
ncbi:MAG: type II toxin-antitoxin system VapB family antitoxin [Sphingomonadaceae bacterium]